LKDVVNSIQGSLDKLGFIPDLYLIHYPFVVKQGDLKALWKIFEDLKDQGKLKSIGVSNFRPQDLDAVLSGAKHKPVVNQVRQSFHLQPFFSPDLWVARVSPIHAGTFKTCS
jgi:diketogulonate reductase-like aldo/keto reductase